MSMTREEKDEAIALLREAGYTGFNAYQTRLDDGRSWKLGGFQREGAGAHYRWFDTLAEVRQATHPNYSPAPDRMFQVYAVWHVLAQDATEAIDVIQHSFAVHDAPTPDRWDVIEHKEEDEEEEEGEDDDEAQGV